MTLAICGSLFLLLVAVINPLGDALIERGLPVPVFVVGLSMVALALVGVPLAVWWRWRTARHHDRVIAQAPVVAAWAQQAGWQPGQWGPEPPTVLQRVRLRSSRPVVVASGQLSGRRAWLMVWDQRFAHRGSPIEDSVTSLALVVDGLAPAARFGMGRISGEGAISGLPNRWAGIPPIALVRTPATHPWGITRTAVWPGTGVPPIEQWATVAAELDAVQGWLLVGQGRLELSARVGDDPLPPERLLAIASRAMALIDR